MRIRTCSCPAWLSRVMFRRGALTSLMFHGMYSYSEGECVVFSYRELCYNISRSPFTEVLLESLCSVFCTATLEGFRNIQSVMADVFIYPTG